MFLQMPFISSSLQFLCASLSTIGGKQGSEECSDLLKLVRGDFDRGLLDFKVGSLYKKIGNRVLDPEAGRFRVGKTARVI
jgi:hypothetical protein